MIQQTTARQLEDGKAGKAVSQSSTRLEEGCTDNDDAVQLMIEQTLITETKLYC